MSETKRYRSGRAIAIVLDKLGWLAAVAGVALAALAVVTAEGDWIAQLAAGLPALILSITGLIAVTVAQLTRAAMDAAEAMREVATLTRDRPRADLDARTALRAAATHAAKAPPPDDIPATPPSLSLRAKTEATAPKLAAPKPQHKGAKVHPIFSARPPGSS
ncbi:MAG: hypothetical protein AAGE03_17925 [Pseudomonadota bacterium]